MTLLVAGLVLFLLLHLIPSAAPLRAALVERMGEKPYRGVFGIVAFASLAMIVWGFSRAPLDPLYVPPVWGRHAAMTVVPIALVLFAAANMPTHIRALVRHPMLIGLFLWALAHLLANGESRSIVLFGGFALFAVVETVSAVARGKAPPTEPAPRFTMDAAAVVGGLLVAGLLMRFHGALFGMPLM